MNNFISGNNLVVSGYCTISGNINQDVTKQAILGDVISESLVCNGDIHADNLTIYNDFSIAGQLSTNSILTNNLDTQYIRLNGEIIDISTLSKLSNINGTVSDYIDGKINDLVGGASQQFDTLKEIQTVLENNSNLNNALVQYQNKVDKYDENGNIKQFVYADKNNVFTGVQNFSNSNVFGLTKNTVGLEQVNNTSDLDKPISNAVFSELNKKLDLTTYNAFLTTNTNNLADKINTTTFNTFVTNNTTNLNSKVDKTDYDTGILTKVDKSTYDSFLISNTNNLSLKLDKSVYDAFLLTNSNNLNTKLDKSLYDTFLINNNINLGLKLNADDFFEIVDLKLDKTDFNTYQLSTNSALNSNNNDINNLKQITTGMTYDYIIDNTKLDNNVEITKTLKINGLDFTTENTNAKNRIGLLETDNTNNKNRLSTIETKTTDFIYDSTTDRTTIDNNLLVNKTLYIGNTSYDVKSEIDKYDGLKVNYTGNNTLIGTNTIRHDTNPLGLRKNTNPTTNNQLNFIFATSDGQINPLVKIDDVILFSGYNLNSDKNGIVIGPWNTTKKGIRINSSDIEIGGVLKTDSHVLDFTNSIMSFKPNITNGSYEFFTTGSTDASLKTKQFGIYNNNVMTYSNTNLNNDNLIINTGLISANKPIEMKNQDIRFINSGTGLSQIYQSNNDLIITNTINSGKISFNNKNSSGVAKDILTIENIEIDAFSNLNMTNNNILNCNTITTNILNISTKSQINTTTNDTIYNNLINTGQTIFNNRNSAGVSKTLMTLQNSTNTSVDIMGNLSMNGNNLSSVNTLTATNLNISASSNYDVYGIRGNGGNSMFITNANNQDLYINNDKSTLGDLRFNTNSPNSNVFIDNGNLSLSGHMIKYYKNPIDATCIGFNSILSYSGNNQSSTSATFNYAVITGTSSTSIINLPVNGIYQINVKVTIKSNLNNVNFSFGIGLSTDSTTTTNPIFINSFANLVMTTANSIENGSQYQTSFSFTAPYTGTAWYILTALRWFSSNIGTISCDVQYTRIA